MTAQALPIQTATAAEHVTWPADRFYWSVIEAPGFSRRGELPAGLLADVQADIPDGEPIHAVCAPFNPGNDRALNDDCGSSDAASALLVCAARLSDLLALPLSTLSLTPESIPTEIAAHADPASLNLLVGRLEPRPYRAARFRRHAAAAAAVLLIAILMSSGFHRRTQHSTALAVAAKQARLDLAAQIAPGKSPDSLPGVAAQLRAVADAASKQKPVTDASLSLAALLRSWPAAVPSKPQSLSITPARIMASVALDADPALFLSAMRAPAGWKLAEPRLNASGSVTRLTLELHPDERAAP
ncbi:MAG: hypothetical protein H7Y88_03645 [Phycisphaerales bacterium]|nr:hypothetical protein [Phycisphaerales bacterium]